MHDPHPVIILLAALVIVMTITALLLAYAGKPTPSLMDDWRRPTVIPRAPQPVIPSPAEVADIIFCEATRRYRCAQTKRFVKNPYRMVQH